MTMLTKDQRILLEQVFDAPNRLYDSESTVADLHALLVVTAIALRGNPLGAAFEAPVQRLQELVRRKHDPAPVKRRLALNATDELRRFVGGELDRDQVENPKQRHDTIRHGFFGDAEASNP
jgi:hypothetical protein